jgi:predicted  nucleic acid-binding Zn-ribbon protein
MAKYDPEKYATDLTKSIEGLNDLIGKVNTRITTATEAKAKADKRVSDLETEKRKLTDNLKQAENLLATAKGEPVPHPPVDAVNPNQEALAVN